MIARGRRPAQAAIRASAGRAKALFYVLLALACVVGGRFYVVQVRDGPTFAKRAYDQRLTTLDLPAHRGSILDRDGNVLVRSLPSQSVYATTGDVVDPERTAREVARVLGGDVDARRLASSLRARAVYVEIDHKVSREKADALAKLALPGIGIVAETSGVRFVPSGRLASSVIGFTGFNENGLDGIEYFDDGLLSGTPGRMVLESDEFGRAIPFAQPHVVVAAKAGHSLELTIDSYLQYDVERILRATVAKWHAESGSAIVMDPSDGAILALANAPDFDVRAYGRFTPDQRRDRAVQDAYEPGSTFKLVTAAAALDSGKVTPDDVFPARDAIEVGGRTIHNAEDGFLAGTGSTETLGEIIVKSHNVGAAEVALRIGSRTMYAAMRRFGFGDPTGVGLPGENPGIVPSVAGWSGSSLATIAFGHGIATTPLALARAYCAIANGGLLLRPRIVARVLDDDGRPVRAYGREVERRAISARTAATLRGYLRDVVTRGTGFPTAGLPGYTTAGKTGTAQVAENGRYVPGAYVASFVGFVPAVAPRYVVLVKISRPVGAIYGGVVAAPAFTEIAKAAMMHDGVMPEPQARVVRVERTSKRSL